MTSAADTAVATAGTCAPGAGRPVRLQVNGAGAWKTVLFVDADDDAAMAAVLVGVRMLYDADDGPGWRIVETTNRQPVVLMHLSRSTLGLWIARAT